MSRDVEREREWAEEAARGASVGPGGFAEAVMIRLERGAVSYGEEGFRERSLDELFRELLEEAPDIGGWSALIAEVLAEGDLADDDLYFVRVHLHAAARAAARSWQYARWARDRYREVANGGRPVQ